MATRIPDDYVYLDWAATAPLCEEALAAMQPYLVAGPCAMQADANANSLHSPGRAAFQALEMARRSVAAAVGAGRPSEIIFTGGATEADNAALMGLARAQAAKRRQKGGGAQPLRVVLSRFEHEAVLQCASELEHAGFDVAYAACDRRGFVTVEALDHVLNKDTAVVSIQAANSEIGSVQPIAQLAKAAHACGAVFHTDAVQALGRMAWNCNEIGVDAATFAAHKVGGPKGVGALYLRARTPFEPFQRGGGQESGHRSGTQNVCGIAGFAAACTVADSCWEHESDRQRALRDLLYRSLGEIPGVTPTVDVPEGSTDYLPNIVHVLVNGFESETLVLKLDQMGFGVSGGSACSSHSLEPSHVLSAMGIPSDKSLGALRISFGRYTQLQDLEAFARALCACVCAA